MIHVKIKRRDANEGSSYWKAYQVPLDPKDNHSTLGVLHYIYQEMDDTLAYAYSCRFKRCGLCAMVINGTPAFACTTPSQTSMVIEPLNNLPVVRDLVIDRRFLLDELRKHPFVSQEAALPFAKKTLAKGYLDLMKCRECLCCLSACPHYDSRDSSFGGPFLFIKIAQQAHQEGSFMPSLPLMKSLGLDLCRNCSQCYCPVGIPIFSRAVEPYLSLMEKDL